MTGPQRLDPELVNRLRLDDAVRIPNARFDNFFPSRVARDALLRDVGSARRLRSRLARGYQAARATTVDVPKWGGGTRPVLDMDVEDRVIYDALVALVASEIPDGAVRWTPAPAERDDREAQIAASGATHVVRADIDSCFELISHRRLAQELLDLTSDDEAVTAITRLLRDAQGSDTGIPQGPQGSRILADVYLSVVDRSLSREGFEFLRSNDDYVMPASSGKEALRIHEHLQRSLCDVALTLNPGKTRVSTRLKFASGFVAQPATRLIDEIASDPRDWGDTYDQSRPLLSALAALATTSSPHAIGHIPVLLSSFPHLTKQLARYLRAMIRSAEAANATAVVDDLLRNHGYRFDWQLGWLYHAMIPAVSRLPPSMVMSAGDSLCDASLPWFVRGRAAVLLSTRADLPVATMHEIIEHAPSANIPDFVAAVANSPWGSDRTAILARAKAIPSFAHVAELVEGTGVRDL